MGSRPLHILDPLEAQELVSDPRWRAKLRRSWWYAGQVEHLLRPHGQTWLDDFIEERHRRAPTPTPFVLETHRRLGKSHYILLRAMRRCIPNPGQRFVYGLPTLEKMEKSIVEPNLAKALKSCPPELRPKKVKNQYRFHNPYWPKGSEPSIMDVVGINHDPDSARGGGVDEAWIDEAGYCDHLEYFVTDVLGFQFIGREAPLLGMVSTPPRSMSHPFIVKYVPEAKRSGRYFGLPASKNPDYSEKDKKIVVDICGGEGTITYRREAEIEHLTDEDAMVVPEWLTARAECYLDFEPPDYYHPMVAMDLGYYPDFSHILFGGVDFKRQALCILDEVQVRKETPNQVAARVIPTEERHWPEGFAHRKSLRRVADGTHLELAAFRDAGLKFEAATKYDADAAIATLRRLVQERRVIVHRRCVQLDYQLQNVIWNDKRKDWIRNDMVGHGDGIKALAYFARHAPWKKNPYPDEPRKRGRLYASDWRRSEPPKHPVEEAWK